mmetsp:Transcript_11375/g.34252  ORF Transcript_11375/g.34252 Transcript_11375/m.34252 type:complete len:276 (-) Transcript_11375:2793-3620(-)
MSSRACRPTFRSSLMVDVAARYDVRITSDNCKIRKSPFFARAAARWKCGFSAYGATSLHTLTILRTQCTANTLLCHRVRKTVRTAAFILTRPTSSSSTSSSPCGCAPWASASASAAPDSTRLHSRSQCEGAPAACARSIDVMASCRSEIRRGSSSASSIWNNARSTSEPFSKTKRGSRWASCRKHATAARRSWSNGDDRVLCSRGMKVGMSTNLGAKIMSCWMPLRPANRTCPDRDACNSLHSSSTASRRATSTWSSGPIAVIRVLRSFPAHSST